MNYNKKFKIWVTGREMDKNMIYHTTIHQWIGTMNFINNKFKWEMIIVFDNEGTNVEVKRYYNYDNKKSFPQSKNEI